MRRVFFHHPDISLTVLRRRTTEAFIDMLGCYGSFLATRGRSWLWHSCFPSERAAGAAMARLRKAGIIAYRRGGDNQPVIELVPGKLPTREICRPDRFWKESWCGFWNVLVYDIPETEKVFRDTLRRLLRRLRVGCLQKSVWISPRDIRPEYNDLVTAVGIDFVSFLFEARTVLGRDGQDLVRTAWDFGRLDALQRWYIRTCERNLEVLRNDTLDVEALATMAREELESYLSVMQDDPLLPHELLPPGYAGRSVFKLHKQFVALAKKCLRASRT